MSLNCSRGAGRYKWGAQEMLGIRMAAQGEMHFQFHLPAESSLPCQEGWTLPSHSTQSSGSIRTTRRPWVRTRRSAVEGEVRVNTEPWSPARSRCHWQVALQGPPQTPECPAAPTVPPRLPELSLCARGYAVERDKRLFSRS